MTSLRHFGHCGYGVPRRVESIDAYGHELFVWTSTAYPADSAKASSAGNQCAACESPNSTMRGADASPYRQSPASVAAIPRTHLSAYTWGRLASASRSDGRRFSGTKSVACGGSWIAGVAATSGTLSDRVSETA